MLALRYLLMIFVFGILSFAYSDPSNHYLEEILDTGKEIILNDGSQWKIGIAEGETWQKGDSLVFEKKMPILGTGSYFFKNLRTQTWAFIYQCTQPPLENFIHTIQEIDWRNGRLLLEDEMIWNLKKDFVEDIISMISEEPWEKGEKVAIIRAADLKGYYVINLDRHQSNIFYALSFDKKKSYYRYTISEIILDKKKANYAVKLENGFIWQLSDGLFSPINIAEIKKWQAGDEVVIYCHVYTVRDRDENRDIETECVDFYLINLRTLSKMPICYPRTQSEWQAPQIEKIERFYSFYFFCYKTLITLSDGSYWRVEEIGDWEIGDRVFFNPASYYSHANYIIINPDYKFHGYNCLMFTCFPQDINTITYAERIH